MIRVTTNIRNVINTVDRVYDAFDDFTPFWSRLVTRVIAPYVEEIFDTEGFGTWIAEQESDLNPLLVESGRLREALTVPHSDDNVIEFTHDSLKYGSDVVYHIFHEEGTDDIPARPILGLLDSPQFELEVEREIEKYFEEIIQRG